MTTDAAVAPLADSASHELVKVYVWQIPVRITHWLIVVTLVTLSVTGLYIGRPFMTVSGPAGESFVMGWMKVIHLYSAWAFTAAVVARVIWMFTGNKYARWDKFVALNRTRRRGIMPVVAFYSFLRDKPPVYVGHNPVAASAYSLVFGLYFLAIATGLVMRGASADVGSLMSWFGGWAPLFGGLQIARWIHHVVMWLLLGFAVHHVYSAWLMSIVDADGTIDSIFSGYKWVERRHLEPGPYRWNNRGDVDE
jgi:Ni/Fe-hydrogenase 1 B-type cytochrome subunit